MKPVFPALRYRVKAVRGKVIKASTQDLLDAVTRYAKQGSKSFAGTLTLSGAVWRRARNELQPDLRRRSPAARTAARARADGATMRDGHQLALNTPLRGVKDAALQQYHGLNIHHRCGRRAARRCSKMSGWPAMPTTRLPLPTLTTRALTDVVLRASAGAWSSWVHDSSSTLLTAC